MNTSEISASKDSAKYKLLCRELLKAEAIILGTISERVKDDYNTGYEQELKMMFALTPPQSIATVPQSPEMNKKLSKIAKEYTNYYKTEKAWILKTTLENTNKFKLFVK